VREMLYLKNVSTLKVDDEKCTGCGACLEVCPHEVLVMNSDHVIIRELDACMECGACSRNCPFEAITVTSGVGCAAGIINSITGGKSGSCCTSNCSCTIEDIKRS